MSWLVYAKEDNKGARNIPKNLYDTVEKFFGQQNAEDMFQDRQTYLNGLNMQEYENDYLSEMATMFSNP